MFSGTTTMLWRLACLVDTGLMLGIVLGNDFGVSQRVEGLVNVYECKWDYCLPLFIRWTIITETLSV